MSSSVTFRHHPWDGWSIDVGGTWADGQLTRVSVQLSTPHRRDWLTGILAFTPDTDGWEYAATAASPGRRDQREASAELLGWIIEETASALSRRHDISAAARAHWEKIVDAADHSRAEFAARYPDGTVPPFEVLARFVFDRASGDLIAA